MSCLHTINKSPGSGLLESCISVLHPGDGILFIEDGIYYCIQDKLIPELEQGIELYSLREDMIARGTLEKNVLATDPVDYQRFVELCCEFDKVISWY